MAHLDLFGSVINRNRGGNRYHGCHPFLFLSLHWTFDAHDFHDQRSRNERRAAIGVVVARMRTRQPLGADGHPSLIIYDDVTLSVDSIRLVLRLDLIDSHCFERSVSIVPDDDGEMTILYQRIPLALSVPGSRFELLIFSL